MLSIPTILGLVSFAAALTVDRRSMLSKKSSYPFGNIVAFGDELSDNGSGSYAHGVTGDPASVYGYDTWTNGPVAVTYLAKMLGMTLDDYAFGGCCGGSKYGATIDEAYRTSPAGAQSVKQQITNYTNAGAKDIKSSLGFVWVGENDLSEHTDAFWLGDPQNTNFAGNISSKIAEQVGRLFDLGAPYVFVANIYPKHIAPVTKKYLCNTNTDCVSTWGEVIQNANDAIESELKQFGDKIIYYDAFKYMEYVVSTASLHGFTAPDATTVYCDGMGDAIWKDCVTDKHGSHYLWMNFIQPTTKFHWYIARDMKNHIDWHFGL
ncbi:hypothetical protein NA57DRAFT_70563 [Rhizodiscina lignyota]|uniref:Uncharacterized protein n=1 Tax=Rhizodiscina lignyota TaxID=1504668 RepID=A0A9P4MAS5_9PEZI|nr:hypothetical protein NA57DRAFT_70563 [Rhizodiscina lignyota]